VLAEALRLMLIRLNDERLLTDLLSFMRASDCIAYSQTEDSIEVLRPTRGAAEASEIRDLLARWTALHPGAEPEILR
jgi:hypothetical protein